MAVRVLDSDGGGSTSSIASGIAFAANEGAGVINLSLGGPAGGGDAAMGDAIVHAAANGAVVVAAAGNDNSNDDVAPVSPCVLGNTNLICVAAVTSTGARAWFSNFGVTTVDLGAPGGDGEDPGPDILSAKPSWTSVFSESFETGIGAWSGTSNKLPWGQANGGSDGVKSAADSVGGNYQNNTESTLAKTNPLNLAGRRGCRMQFDVRLGITDVDAAGNPFDFMGVGVLSSAGNIGLDLFGDTGTAFERVEMSISPLDGQIVTPTLRFHSDQIVVGDGGYVDNLHVDCRGQTYNDVVAGDDAAAGGSYTAISGTSMAAPHVAGVAALVRALDPGVPPSQVVQALKDGARPAPGMAGVTVTGGVVDAVGAMDALLAVPKPPPPPPPTASTAAQPARQGSLRVRVGQQERRADHPGVRQPRHQRRHDPEGQHRASVRCAPREGRAKVVPDREHRPGDRQAEAGQGRVEAAPAHAQDAPAREGSAQERGRAHEHGDRPNPHQAAPPLAVRHEPACNPDTSVSRLVIFPPWPRATTSRRSAAGLSCSTEAWEPRSSSST
jgi:subtilisin family serine protease